jgi:hypothetical protein
MARRLDRPTSTVTREVMRNGGPTGYRADLAHRATERRTRTQRGRDGGDLGGGLFAELDVSAEAAQELGALGLALNAVVWWNTLLPGRRRHPAARRRVPPPPRRCAPACR